MDWRVKGNRVTWTRLSLIIAGAIGVLALVAAGAFVFVKLNDAFHNDPTDRSARSVPNANGDAAGAPALATTTTAAAPAAAVLPVTTTPAPTTDDATTVPADPATTAAPAEAPATTVPPTASSAAPETTDAPSTTAPRATTTTPRSSSSAPEEAGTTYATLPDGSPVPILAVFDAERVTIGGAVPSQAAKDLLGGLAVARSKNPNVEVENLLTIDPTVPSSIGVRVIELTSVRFPSGSADILPEHALELNRIADVMKALPNITTLVIGHSDQVGSENTNFALSEARARSVVTYLVSQGIAPSRLASRGVGELDLLSINNDETSLALNRRTEFVISGLIVGT